TSLRSGTGAAGYSTKGHAMSDRRSTGRFLTAALCALLAVSGHVSAQTPTAQPSQGTSPQPVSDALGRDTPFGTVTGFNLAVRRSDFVVAARYLQLSGRSSREIENISRDLNELLDRYFTHTLTT